MNVGYFHTEHRERDVDATRDSMRVPGVLVGLRFDRIEVMCSARDLCDHEFTSWVQLYLMNRVSDARPGAVKILLDVRH